MKYLELRINKFKKPDGGHYFQVSILVYDPEQESDICATLIDDKDKIIIRDSGNLKELTLCNLNEINLCNVLETIEIMSNEALIKYIDGLSVLANKHQEYLRILRISKSIPTYFNNTHIKHPYSFFNMEES